MPNWTESMQQTFEYYIVDPGTWQDIRQLSNVKSASITWDSESSTLGSATIDIEESIGEAYIRIYLITIQNGVREKHALGTFLVQTPSTSFDGKTKSISMDAYTPLLELNEKYPPYGYFVPKYTHIIEQAYKIISTDRKVRAPVIEPIIEEPIIEPIENEEEIKKNKYALKEPFVADPKNTYLTFIQDLIGNVDYIFSIDELGRISFTKKPDLDSLQPVWTFDDGNSSILYPDIDMDQDLYGVPNVVEIICSTNDGVINKTVENNDINSPTSISNRGRRIEYREIDPNMIGDPTDVRVEEYSKKLLKELSSIEYTITYTHGYCPVHVGDCVRLNYSRAGLNNIKARVISQDIKCETGCSVTETAVFVKKLWG